AGTAFGQPLARGVREHAVRGGDEDVPRSVLLQQLDRAGDGAAGVDHVVGEDAGLAPHFADDAVGLDLVGHQRVAGLVDERQRYAAQRVGPLFGDAHAAGVGGDHDHVMLVVVLGDV